MNSNEEIQWKENGYAHFKDFFTVSEAHQVSEWTNELQSWPEKPGAWMKYFEKDSNENRQLCRIENFLGFHRGFASISQRADILERLFFFFDEPAVIFKEKINFKLPGGGGFTAHQDAPAFQTFKQNFHITMMIPIDASNARNGGLEVVDGYPERSLLEQEKDGTISLALREKLEWKTLDIEPGDLLFFHSYLPHRSGPNQSQATRRAAFITYNPVSQGSFREKYFEQKRKFFPPEIERIPGQAPVLEGNPFNLGNPMK